jgi:homoserine O-succinyltransferase
MPLIIEGPIPSRWAENCAENLGSDASVLSASRFPREECVTLALVNNMPDPALEDTELQFFELLDTASGDIPVIVKLYSLTGVPRTDRGRRHLDSFYYNFDDIWQSRMDGMIVTGTEPHQPDLRDEPYWSALTQLFEWAEQNTLSTVLSCLAAHASVLHGDGIPRHRLPDKQFGVFESARGCDHALTVGGGDRFRFPHSRWNEVREDELTGSGYSILTSSKESGVDLFAKKRKNTAATSAAFSRAKEKPTPQPRLDTSTHSRLSFLKAFASAPSPTATKTSWRTSRKPPPSKAWTIVGTHPPPASMATGFDI